jgi:hypothetical protein
MRSGLAGRESNSGLVRIGMEDRSGALVGFRRSEKRASGGGGSVENGMRCRQSRRGREGPRGCRSPISSAVVVLPNRSFLLHHQIRPGFLPPLSSLTRSETPRPTARKPGHAEGDAEDISPPAFSPSSFSVSISLSRESVGGRKGWGPPVGA